MAAGAAWLTRKRLDNQGLSRIRFRSAPEVVRWFVAVQSQDFGGAKWGVGQRLQGVTDAAIERAFDAAGAMARDVCEADAEGAEDAGIWVVEHAEDAELASDGAGVLRGSAAESDQDVIGGICAFGDGDEADRGGHVGVGDLEQARR